jgi:hypothetical protein
MSSNRELSNITAMAIISPLGGVRAAGVAFAASFTLAVTVGLGDLLGAFADAGDSFPAYFDDRPERLRHAAGAYLLAGSGLAFAIFIAGFRALGREAGSGVCGALALVTSGTFAALLGLAAAALSTVSMSVGFGTIMGDPGIREAQHLLPQLGYVVLAVPAALAGGLAVWLMAGLGARNGTLPRWITGLGRGVGVAQVFAFYSLPMILLPLWTLIAAFGMRSSSARQGPQPSDP